ncbi:MAG TPA: hypothetical protein VN285_11055 [Candidatus Deferrimicrobium sp.]|nr:hypothetical protein [Candidatus Deferrimicrobium sp.]
MMYRQLISFVVTILLLSSSVSADRRKYVWTYQFATMAPGTAELELYQTTKLSATDSWEYRIEIEHGLTPRWDLSIYQIFTQKENEAFKWDAFQIRTRYKLAEQGRFLMDPLLYVEYHRKIDLKKQNKLETKLILARDFAKANVAVNPVYEFFWAPGDPVHEIGVDVGLSYELSFKYVVGIESSSRYEFLKGIEDEKASYLGPTVSYAAGPIWYSVGYAWGLTDESDDARVRFLMGIEL